jgi:hypothetical protein
MLTVTASSLRDLPCSELFSIKEGTPSTTHDTLRCLRCLKEEIPDGGSDAELEETKEGQASATAASAKVAAAATAGASAAAAAAAPPPLLGGTSPASTVPAVDLSDDGDDGIVAAGSIARQTKAPRLDLAGATAPPGGGVCAPEICVGEDDAAVPPPGLQGAADVIVLLSDDDDDDGASSAGHSTPRRAGARSRGGGAPASGKKRSRSKQGGARAKGAATAVLSKAAQKRAEKAAAAERTQYEQAFARAVKESLSAELPVVPPGTVRRQLKHPSEDDLRCWSHHCGCATVADPILAAVGQDLVSFTFGLEVVGKDPASFAPPPVAPRVPGTAASGFRSHAGAVGVPSSAVLAAAAPISRLPGPPAPSKSLVGAPRKRIVDAAGEGSSSSAAAAAVRPASHAKGLFKSPLQGSGAAPSAGGAGNPGRAVIGGQRRPVAASTSKRAPTSKVVRGKAVVKKKRGASCSEGESSAAESSGGDEDGDDEESVSNDSSDDDGGTEPDLGDSPPGAEDDDDDGGADDEGDCSSGRGGAENATALAASAARLAKAEAARSVAATRLPPLRDGAL